MNKRKPLIKIVFSFNLLEYIHRNFVCCVSDNLSRKGEKANNISQVAQLPEALSYKLESLRFYFHEVVEISR
jgi:hypothetical protein